jgi:hypothetical protein
MSTSYQFPSCPLPIHPLQPPPALPPRLPRHNLFWRLQGERGSRLGLEELLPLVEEVVEGVHTRWPHALVQFEDFETDSVSVGCAVMEGGGGAGGDGGGAGLARGLGEGMGRW